MAESKDICYLTITEGASLIRGRDLSPVELTRAFLDRIDRLDAKLNAYITVLYEDAMADARKSEAEILAGNYRGPLHGIPIALKDLYDTIGIRTTASSRVMKDRIPTEDATATAKLKAAGAVLLGKLSMHEFALGGPDPTCGFPMAKNPWNLDHMPGGSSSGSGTAVAAGLAMGTLGSCTGGSIRGPAAHCGIAGIKATYGRVSRYGVVPLSWSLDHCGPLTWTVEDSALMLQAIAGFDHKDPTTSRASVPDYTESLIDDIEGMRVGVPRDYFFPEDGSVNSDTKVLAEGALETLKDLGADLVDISIPSIEYAGAAQQTIMLSEAFTYHRKNLIKRPRDFGEMVRERFRLGGVVSGADYIQAQRVRNVIKREFADTLKTVDVIATPTMSTPPPSFITSSSRNTARLRSLTGPYNLTGMPAISVPCGFTPDGLPIGFQIAGKPFDESTVFQVAYAYQQKARWYELRPPGLD